MNLAPKLKYEEMVLCFYCKKCASYKPCLSRAKFLILDCATSCLLEGCILVQGFCKSQGAGENHHVLSNHHSVLAFSGMCHCLLNSSVHLGHCIVFLAKTAISHEQRVFCSTPTVLLWAIVCGLSPIHPQTPLGLGLLCWSLLLKASPWHRPYWQIWLRLSLLLNPSKPTWDFCSFPASRISASGGWRAEQKALPWACSPLDPCCFSLDSFPFSSSSSYLM